MYKHYITIDNYGKPKLQSTPVSQHFNTCCHRPAKLRFQILETIRGNPSLESTTTYRQNRERWWILTLRTLNPLGINAKV